MIIESVRILRILAEFDYYLKIYLMYYIKQIIPVIDSKGLHIIVLLNKKNKLKFSPFHR